MQNNDIHTPTLHETTVQAHANMEECIRLCWDARHIVQKTLIEHCLPKGGRHVGQAHVQSMLDCMDMCQAAADFMTRGSPLHTSVCAAAANVADACADSCEALHPKDTSSDSTMQRCADACRACAIACRSMATDGTALEDLHMDQPPTLSEEFPSLPS